MKMGVREICDVVFKAKSNIKIGTHVFEKGEPVLYIDTAKTSTMETAATTVYAQGGRGNSRLLAWEGEKTVTFTVEDALISPKGLAVLSGAGLINADTGSEIYSHATQTVNFKVKESATIPSGETTATATVKYAEVDKATGSTGIKVNDTDYPIFYMLLDENGEMSGGALNTKTKIGFGYATSNFSTIVAAETTTNTIPVVYIAQATGEGADNAVYDAISIDQEGLLDYYNTFASDAIQINITPDQFAGYYYVEASTLFRRELDGMDLPAEFIVPKAKIQSNFTFSMASSGDPSTFTFTMDAMPDYVNGQKEGGKVLYALQILGADDNYDLSGSDNGSLDTVQRFVYNKDKGQYLGRKKLTTDDTTPES